MRRFCLGLLTAALTFSLGVATAPTLNPRRHRPAVTQPAAPAERPRPLVQIVPLPDEPADSFYDVAVLDNGELWAVGYDSHDLRIMWHSDDRGRTWEARAEATPEVPALHDIQFLDERRGWAAGSGNVIVRTTDGGKSWERLRLPLELGYIQVRFYDSRVGYVGGSTGYRKRDGETVWGVAILRTTDGGRSWRVCYRDGETHSVWAIAAPTE